MRFISKSCLSPRPRTASPVPLRKGGGSDSVSIMGIAPSTVCRRSATSSIDEKGSVTRESRAPYLRSAIPTWIESWIEKQDPFQENQKASSEVQTNRAVSLYCGDEDDMSIIASDVNTFLRH